MFDARKTLPNGLRFQHDGGGHVSLIVTEPMTRQELIAKLNTVANEMLTFCAKMSIQNVRT